MPKESKIRGRREERKRKRQEEDQENVVNKRQKARELLAELGEDVPITGTDNDAEPKEERPFYGMLEDEEQEYFRRADELLELNDFPSDEERSFFLANVYKEAEGKELKIACSQSCSRLMERLILLSSVEQKKKLFEQFAGNFAHLVQHRFASHCCEMLFIQSAGTVTEELTGDVRVDEEGETPFVTMESLFLQTLDELEGDMASLLTNRFASHTLRVLLVVLSGRPLEKASTKTLIQSKRKEKVSVTGFDTAPTEFSLSKRAVTSSFSFAVEKIISDTIAAMDESFIRILAVHPTGNPTLQLLLELELTAKSKSATPSKTILQTLLPDDVSTEGSESSVFINGLIYDAIGSRLLETIVTFAPGKLFKQLYRSLFKDRIAGLARNEIASYVVIKVLTRLSKEDLEEAATAILSQIPGLVERSRTTVIKTLLERCYARGADVDALTEAIASAYGADPSTLLLKMSCIDDLPSLTTAVLPPPSTSETETAPQTIPKPTPSQLHGALLAQTLFSIPGSPTTLLQNAALALPHMTLLTLALFTPTSHILQAALLPTSSNLTFRRKIITTLLFPLEKPSHDPILSLADSNIGTHILDRLLLNGPSLFSLAERIASSLVTHENHLRDSFTGRIVWRNWQLDLFKRRRGEWVRRIKDVVIPEPLLPAPEISPEEKANKNKKKDASQKNKKNKDKKGSTTDTASINPLTADGQPKSAIQLAREKFAANKGKPKGFKTKGKGVGTGANGIVADREKASGKGATMVTV